MLADLRPCGIHITGETRENCIQDAGRRALFALTCLTPLAANAQTTLRIQTPHAESSLTGELIVQFVDDIETMSGRDIDIEMYYFRTRWSIPAAPSMAAVGVLDSRHDQCQLPDRQGPGLPVRRRPDGRLRHACSNCPGFTSAAAARRWNQLYGESGMTFVGWHGGQESLVSTCRRRPRRPEGIQVPLCPRHGIRDLQQAGRQARGKWDFSEIFTALKPASSTGPMPCICRRTKALALRYR